MLFRAADPHRDAAACADIYAPYVSGSAVSFEDDPPDARQLHMRIERITQTHPWLVAETDAGTGPGTPMPPITVTGPPTAGPPTWPSTWLASTRDTESARVCTESCFPCWQSNGCARRWRESPCLTRPASLCTSGWVSRSWACTGISAGRPARGGTWGGGSSSCSANRGQAAGAALKRKLRSIARGHAALGDIPGRSNPARITAFLERPRVPDCLREFGSTARQPEAVRSRIPRFRRASVPGGRPRSRTAAA